MKANESVKNYPSVRRMYANYAARAIKEVCKTIGPRFSGSEAELKGQEYMAKELKTCCDEVMVEPFEVHPWAFLGWVPLCVVCMLTTFACFFVANFLGIWTLPLNIVGLVLTVVALFFIVTEFLFYMETLDKFAPKKTSHNAIGIRKASGEAKRRIILSGHADSSMEWRFTYYGGPKLLVPMIAGALVAIAVSIVAIILAFAMGEDLPRWIPIVLVCFSPVLLGNLFFYDKKRIVEGANDNLTGCFCSIAVLKYLQDNNIRFEDTEVWCVCTGSEEAGLRGAKAFCQAHGKDFNDIETVYVGLDTMRDFDFMAIYSRDMTLTVKSDPEVCNLVKQGALIAGYDLPYKGIFLGASDAARVTKCGIKSCSLAAMDPAPARYYHTRLDTSDNLDPKTIEAGIDICLETLFLYDEKGLKV